VYRRLLELLLVLGLRKDLLDVLGREPVLEMLVQLLLEERRALLASPLVACLPPSAISIRSMSFFPRAHY
jgi:hypothetical protein